MQRLFLFLLISIKTALIVGDAQGTLAVRPFTAHFFYDTFAKNLTAPEKDQYLQVLQNHLISKDQAMRKIDSIAHEKGDGFEVCIR